MMSHTMLHPPESSNVLLLLKYDEVLVAQTSKKCGTATCNGGRTTSNESNLDKQKKRGEKEVIREKGEKKKRKSRRGRKRRRS